MVFLPYAAVAVSWSEYTTKVSEAIGLALHPAEELERADLIVIGGGNTFQVLRECRARGLLEPIAHARTPARGPVSRLGRRHGSRLPDDQDHERTCRS
jgi:peptidase E